MIVSDLAHLEVITEETNITGGGTLQWVPAANGEVPPGAVNGGIGQTLYVCRALYNGAVHPGKIFGKTCHFSSNYRHIEASNYEVLTHK